MPPIPLPPAGLSPTELHIRTARIKLSGKLKGRYIDVATAARPEINSARGGQHITNVWNGRKADQVLTEAWEAAAGMEPESAVLLLPRPNQAQDLQLRPRHQAA